MYQVFITDFAKQNLRKLKHHGKKTLLQLRRVLGDLESDPYGMTKELHAPLHGFRSLHSGRFRAVIRISENEVRVYVAGIGWHESGNRDDIYQVVHRAILAGAIKLEVVESE